MLTQTQQASTAEPELGTAQPQLLTDILENPHSYELTLL